MSYLDKVFPNISVGASYDPYTQIITYNDLTREEFKEVLKSPYSLVNAKNTALLVHEVCHYIDNLGTLSGQILLRKIFAAYNAIKSRDEYQFYHMIDLFRAIRKMSYEKYYKTINLTGVDKKVANWSFEVSMGARFDANGKVSDSHPVIFNRFKHRGTLVARIPFSIEALWETNAMAEEIKSHMRIITEIKDKGERMVQQAIVQRDLQEYFYTPELLTYSSPAHLVSSLLNISDIYLSFMIAKSISSISLNLPKMYHSQIKKPKTLTLPKARKNGLFDGDDPSYIFYLLFSNLRESKENVITQNGIDTEKILFVNNLPSEKKLILDVEREILRQKRMINEGPFTPQYAVQNEFGVELVRLLGLNTANLDTDVYLSFAKGALTLCELECIDENNPLVIKDKEISDYKKEIDAFIGACGY